MLFDMKSYIDILLSDYQCETNIVVVMFFFTRLYHDCYSRGINMRYLGRVTQLLAQQPTLTYLHVS
jgi:hypothetical protein